MHSDGRGVSGSSKPVDAKQPDWIDYDAQEVEDLVVRLREDGFDPAQIGLKLRDVYGIPDVKQITEKKITEILEEADVAPETPEDLQNLVDKAENLKAHLDENKNDQEAERELELTEAKVRKVADYHRQEGNIPEDWKYVRDE